MSNIVDIRDGRVRFRGHDITDALVSYGGYSDRKAVELTLTIIVEYPLPDGPVESIAMPTAVREMLIEMGWTPPT